MEPQSRQFSSNREARMKAAVFADDAAMRAKNAYAKTPAGSKALEASNQAPSSNKTYTNAPNWSAL
jgi:hypothetical protein